MKSKCYDHSRCFFFFSLMRRMTMLLFIMMTMFNLSSSAGHDNKDDETNETFLSSSTSLSYEEQEEEEDFLLKIRKAQELQIIGGDVAERDRFQYGQVSLILSDGRHTCGGSLITYDMVLSAAHCANFVDQVQVNVYNRLQDDEILHNVQTFSTKKIIIHPDYLGELLRFDLMLIQLDGVVTNVPYPVKLNSDRNVPEPGDILTAIGFGITEFSDLSNVLKMVDLPYIPNNVCRNLPNENGQAWGAFLTNDMLCTFDPEGESACNGDSGSPLLMVNTTQPDGTDDVQVGVVSWGEFGCGGNFPGVYNRVSRFYDWIEGRVCATSIALGPNFDCSTEQPSSIPTSGPSLTPTAVPSDTPSSIPSTSGPSNPPTISNTPTRIDDEGSAAAAVRFPIKTTSYTTFLYQITTTIIIGIIAITTFL